MTPPFSEASNASPKTSEHDPSQESTPGVQLSVVLFCTQNAKHTPVILAELLEFLESSEREYELIVALDGHLVGLQARLEDEFVAKPQVKVVRINASQGQVATIRAGIAVSRGKWIVTFPSYPQVLPEAIDDILVGLQAGNDYVVGVRRNRSDSSGNRLASRIFNRLVRTTTGVKFKDIACGVHGLRASVGRSIPNYGENQLFLPILLSRDGYRVAEVKVPAGGTAREARFFSPATFARRGLDILTLAYLFRFTHKPLRPFGALGIILLLLGGLLGGVLLYQRLMLGQGLADRPLLLLALLLMTAGLQVVILGFLGELLIYLHYRDQVNYRVRERFSGQENESGRARESDLSEQSRED